ncbi:MAG: biotin--[acetyl-CoA-carboxylase] ligase [Candidatus Symbiothrix sp.]|jgi:BirA family biotin operon repressor/biotin-[acetyl-CoA-carboxylase] ligase|nr:biotin--[acetyl-CoA-carboxylase] ligase [Candidatus Symbiothrix sp.]
MNIIKIETTTSTNLFLKELAGKQVLEEGTVALAGTQTAGRGQAGNYWESEPGKNITCSILLHPTFLLPKQHFLLSETVALGVKETLDFYLKNVTVKWPNDIYVEDRKIAGILIENELMGQQFSRSVIGIGLNVNQEVFTSNAPNPVSLKQLLGVDMNVDELTEKMVERILYWYEKLKAGETKVISQTYHDFLYRKSGFHWYEDKTGRFKARIKSVAEDGFLLLETDKGEERCYAFKEVSMR